MPEVADAAPVGSSEAKQVTPPAKTKPASNAPLMTFDTLSRLMICSRLRKPLGVRRILQLHHDSEKHRMGIKTLVQPKMPQTACHAERAPTPCYAFAGTMETLR